MQKTQLLTVKVSMIAAGPKPRLAPASWRLGPSSLGESTLGGGQVMPATARSKRTVEAQGSPAANRLRQSEKQPQRPHAWA